ncbi:amiloride-sensitive sodium channel subunit beta [Trichonephila inaurata madagascariensis]|uniref:Amiloride-sensitive sodium channel subunit beta n=1 Tax=Trichonephila inaurata madagascariensis TaxID=2747483 RepID=A0A8X6XIS2_9ARAC|nr:amiloride-sensitive sodium channel subunit beta [Trichonephila inaurata madagascariensis]
MEVIDIIRSSKTSDMHDMEYKLLPNVKTLDDYGISYDTLIVSCNYQGFTCDINEDMTTLYSPNHGKCYMFNYVGEEDPKVPKKPKVVRHAGRDHGLTENMRRNDRTTVCFDRQIRVMALRDSL